MSSAPAKKRQLDLSNYFKKQFTTSVNALATDIKTTAVNAPQLETMVPSIQPLQPVDITISDAGLSHIGTGNTDSFVEQTITSSTVPSAPSLFEKTIAEAAETTSSDTAQVEVGSLPPIDIGVVIKKINAGGKASDPELRRCLESRWIPANDKDFPFSIKGVDPAKS